MSGQNAVIFLKSWPWVRTAFQDTNGRWHKKPRGGQCSGWQGQSTSFDRQHWIPGIQSRLVKGPVRESWGGQEPPLQRGGEYVRTLCLWESRDLNILRSCVREYGEELTWYPHAPCERNTAPHPKTWGRPGPLERAAASSLSTVLTVWAAPLSRLQSEEWAHFLLKCPCEPADNHISRKLILAGRQRPAIGQDICLTCCWTCGKKMQN